MKFSFASEETGGMNLNFSIFCFGGVGIRNQPFCTGKRSGMEGLPQK